jgi:hypothetical protein
MCAACHMPTTLAARDPLTTAQHQAVCRRCNGTGLYRSYGRCYRCNGDGVVSMARVRAYFEAAARATPPADDRPQGGVIARDLRAEAIAAAKARAAELHEQGWTGRIKILADRVELLARHPRRRGSCLHETWHPRGFDSETLEGPPSKNWPAILAD